MSRAPDHQYSADRERLVRMSGYVYGSLFLTMLFLIPYLITASAWNQVTRFQASAPTLLALDWIDALKDRDFVIVLLGAFIIDGLYIANVVRFAIGIIKDLAAWRRELTAPHQ